MPALFDPGGAFGDPGNIDVQAPGNGTGTDLDIVLGQPVFDIAGSRTVCEAGSLAYLHVPVAATWSIDGASYDPTGTPPQIAICHGDPQSGDWKAGTWLSRTAPIAPGLYARLAITQTPPVGRYRVYANVAGYILRAPGFVTFE